MPLLLESKDRAFAVFQTLEDRKIQETAARNSEVQGDAVLAECTWQAEGRPVLRRWWRSARFAILPAATRQNAVINGRSLRVHLVVPDMGLHFDEVVRVEVVVLGHTVVVPSKTFDGVRFIPERQHLEMCFIRFGAAQTPRATISSRRQILGKRNPTHKVQVFITL